MKRRDFVRNGIIVSSSISIMSPLKIRRLQNDNFPKIKFGVCSDIHHDFYPGVPERLSEFVNEMEKRNADFIIQLGDFCRPEPKNKKVVDIFNKFSKTKLHVLGNHDIEKDTYPKNDVIKFWGALDKYYSLDLKEYHLVVLDGNCGVNYNRFISSAQLDWFENDISQTNFPTIVFCHQSLDHDSGLENANRVRAVIDRCNEKSGFKKIFLVLSGHHHLDYYNVINGTHYIQINSMCYKWQGNQFAESPYPNEVNKKYPLLSKMSHYKDSLFAFFEIFEDGTLQITGKKSTFFGKSPQELGMPDFLHIYPVVPKISNRIIQL